jgi:hypothetical protein
MTTAHNTKDRTGELLAAAMQLVTPEVVEKLDMLVNFDLSRRILEAQANGDEDTATELQKDPIYQAWQAGLRALERLLRDKTNCSQPATKQYIAKALRRRRGEVIEADNRGGARPGAGRPIGS